MVRRMLPDGLRTGVPRPVAARSASTRSPSPRSGSGSARSSSRRRPAPASRSSPAGQRRAARPRDRPPGGRHHPPRHARATLPPVDAVVEQRTRGQESLMGSPSPEPATSAARSPRELVENGHKVLLIDNDPAAIKPERSARPNGCSPTRASWPRSRRPGCERCDVVIACTATTRSIWWSRCWPRPSSPSREVGRVNHPGNEWLFTDAWGVDVAVSTPRIMAALVEEAVTVGDMVRLFTFRGNANLVELTLPEESPYVGRPSGLIPWPDGCSLVLDPPRRPGLPTHGRTTHRGRRRAPLRSLPRSREPSSSASSPPEATPASPRRRAARGGVSSGGRSRRLRLPGAGSWGRGRGPLPGAPAGSLCRPRARARFACCCRRFGGNAPRYDFSAQARPSPVPWPGPRDPYRVRVPRHRLRAWSGWWKGVW